MQAMGQYVCTLVAASLFVGILTLFQTDKKGSAPVFRLAGGLFLAFTILHPVAEVNFDHLERYTQSFADQGQQAVQTGQNICSHNMESYIKSAAEAYILDKAKTWKTDIRVEVTLGEDAVFYPAGARIEGKVSPLVRNRLEQMMEDDLNIPRENQIWIGQS